MCGYVDGTRRRYLREARVWDVEGKEAVPEIDVLLYKHAELAEEHFAALRVALEFGGERATKGGRFYTCGTTISNTPVLFVCVF